MKYIYIYSFIIAVRPSLHLGVEAIEKKESSGPPRQRLPTLLYFIYIANIYIHTIFLLGRT